MFDREKLAPEVVENVVADVVTPIIETTVEPTIELVEETVVFEESVIDTAVEVTEVEEVDDVVVEPATIEAEPAITEPVAAEPVVVETPSPEPSNVVSLFGKDRQRPEPAKVNPDHPSVDRSSVDDEVPTDVADTPVPARDQVDDIFARLRASSVSKPTEGSVVEARKQTDDTKTAARPSAPVVPAVRDDSAFERRNEALAPLVTKMSRKLKRVLADEENEVLEYLRAKKPVMKIESMCGRIDAHVAKYVDAIVDEVMEAAKAGASGVVGDAKKSPAKSEIVPAISDSVKTLLVAPLRERLSAALAAHAADKEGAAKTVRGLYRQWKSTNIDEHVDDVACLAYGRGMYVTFAPGTQVCWMVDPNGPACADAEDNSLAGCVVLGNEFPTGHAAPLAHAGCRCLLAPMPN